MLSIFLLLFAGCKKQETEKLQTFSSEAFAYDLGDGWEDKEVHNDPDEIRLKALQMGANIIQYVFLGENEAKTP